MKRYHQYKMDFEGRGVQWSAVCMGVAIFLSALYYLGIRNMKDVGGLELLVCLWLPVIAGVAYLVLLRIVRFNAPGVYAIFGAAFCAILILSSFVSGSALRMIIGIPAYLICGAALLIVVGGYFPARLPAVLLFGIAIGLRVILFDLGRLSITQWIEEGAQLFMLAAFMFLPLGLKSINKKELP